MNMFAIIYFRFTDINDRVVSSDNDYIYLTIAEREAITGMNDFALRLIKKYKEDKRNIEDHLNIGFGMCILFFYNFLILGDDKVHTLSQSIPLILDSSHEFWVKLFIQAVIVVYCFLVVSIFILSLKPYDDGKVFLPRKHANTE